jgi:hypothetical protein
LQPWYDFLAAAADDTGHVPGDLLDATPFNLVADADGSLHYIDREWSWAGTLPLRLLVTRGLAIFYVRARDRGCISGGLARKSVAQLISETAKAFGGTYTPHDMKDYLQIQGQILDQVGVRSVTPARQFVSLAASKQAIGVLRVAAKIKDLGRRATRRALRVLRK